MYGQRKAIAKRTPVHPQSNTPRSSAKTQSGPGESAVNGVSSDALASRRSSLDALSTPSVTEGETATDTELETETELDCPTPTLLNRKKPPRHVKALSNASSASVDSNNNDGPRPNLQGRATSQHDLLHKYFRRDTLVLRNLDLLR